MDRGSEFRVDGVGWDQDVANAFGQASGHASQGAEECGFRARLLAALEGVDAVLPLLVVGMFELFDPGEALPGPLIRANE